MAGAVVGQDQARPVLFDFDPLSGRVTEVLQEAPLLRVGSEVDHEGLLRRPHRFEVAGELFGFGERQCAPPEDAAALPEPGQRSCADLGPVTTTEWDVGRSVGRHVAPAHLQHGVDDDHAPVPQGGRADLHPLRRDPVADRHGQLAQVNSHRSTAGELACDGVGYVRPEALDHGPIRAARRPDRHARAIGRVAHRIPPRGPAVRRFPVADRQAARGA